MIYTHLSSKDTETRAETEIFSSCGDVSIVSLCESDIYDTGNFCLPPHLFLRWGRMSAPGCPLWEALPPGFDRKGQRKAGRSLQNPCKKICWFFYSVGQCTSQLGAEGVRLIFWNFLEALLTVSWIAIKTPVWGQVWKHCRAVIFAGEILYRGWVKSKKATDIDTFLLHYRSWGSFLTEILWTLFHGQALQSPIMSHREDTLLPEAHL